MEFGKDVAQQTEVLTDYGLTFFEHFQNVFEIGDKNFQFDAATFSVLKPCLQSAEHQGFLGIHGNLVAFQFCHQTKSEAWHFAVDGVVETILLLGGVKVDAFVQAFAHDGHKVGKRVARLGDFGDDDGISTLHTS